MALRTWHMRVFCSFTTTVYISIPQQSSARRFFGSKWEILKRQQFHITTNTSTQMPYGCGCCWRLSSIHCVACAVTCADAEKRQNHLRLRKIKRVRQIEEERRQTKQKKMSEQRRTDILSKFPIAFVARRRSFLCMRAARKRSRTYTCTHTYTHKTGIVNMPYVMTITKIYADTSAHTYTRIFVRRQKYNTQKLPRTEM